MAKPTCVEIRKRVVHNISVISGFPESAITDPTRLTDLGLTEDLRGALAPGFRAIAQEFVPDAVVTKTECKALKKVKDAVDLVSKRAGGCTPSTPTDGAA